MQKVAAIYRNLVINPVNAGCNFSDTAPSVAWMGFAHMCVLKWSVVCQN